MVRALARSRLHYAWVVLAVTFLVMLMAAGFRATPGVFLRPYEDEFGWSPGLVGGGISISLLLYGAGAPFLAALVERLGMRRICSVALVVVAIASALTLVMDSPWQFYVLWGVLVGTATGAIAIPLAAIVANRWFAERHGLVVGLLGASFAAGQLIFLPLLAWLVEDYGWRTASAAVSGTAFFVIAPLAIVLIRDRPEQLGLRPYGATDETPPPKVPEGNPFRHAIDVVRMAAHQREGRRDVGDHPPDGDERQEQEHCSDQERRSCERAPKLDIPRGHTAAHGFGERGRVAVSLISCCFAGPAAIALIVASTWGIRKSRD